MRTCGPEASIRNKGALARRVWFSYGILTLQNEGVRECAWCTGEYGTCNTPCAVVPSLFERLEGCECRIYSMHDHLYIMLYCRTLCFARMELCTFSKCTLEELGLLCDKLRIQYPGSGLKDLCPLENVSLKCDSKIGSGSSAPIHTPQREELISSQAWLD